jgi:hypothetical protein
MRSFDSGSLEECGRQCDAVKSADNFGVAYFSSDSNCVCGPADDFF